MVSISASAEEYYYDLQVPGANSYLANGIWNHNSGKSRCGAEQVHEWANAMPGSRGILVGRTADDVRNTMLEGESGLLTMYPSIEYMPSYRRLKWPNGTIAQCYYAESPNTLRGPQCHWFWADEISSWADAHLGDREDTAWNNLMMGCRLAWPEWTARGIATFTPKPNRLVQDLLNQKSTVLTAGSTFDNEALDEATREYYREQYEGTRTGRQELYGELLLTADNALWSTEVLDANRVKEHGELTKIAIGWDPATTSGEHSDEHGIVVCGIDANRHSYVLEDCSGRMTPDKAAFEIVRLYNKWHPNKVVYEKNAGGEFIEAVLKGVATGLPLEGVHAKLGKRLRAEPVQAKYEQGMVHHVGYFSHMETQMTTWDPDDQKQKSPDRVDACVYALTWLYQGTGITRVSSRIGVRK